MTEEIKEFWYEAAAWKLALSINWMRSLEEAGYEGTSLFNMAKMGVTQDIIILRTFE